MGGQQGSKDLKPELKTGREDPPCILPFAFLQNGDPSGGKWKFCLSPSNLFSGRLQ